MQTYNANGTGQIVVKGLGESAKTTQTAWKFVDDDKVLEVDEGSKITRDRITTLTSS